MRRSFLSLASFALVLLWPLKSMSAGLVPVNTDFETYCKGPNNSNCQWRIDNSGNVFFMGLVASSATGNNFFPGAMVYTPSAIQVISTTTVLTPTSTFEVISATGAIVWGANGNVNFNTGLSTANATNGQFVILEATSSLYTVTLTSNTVQPSYSSFWLGSATRLLDNNHVIGLIFDSIQGVWKELFYR